MSCPTGVGTSFNVPCLKRKWFLLSQIFPRREQWCIRLECCGYEHVGYINGWSWAHWWIFAVPTYSRHITWWWHRNLAPDITSLTHQCNEVLAKIYVPTAPHDRQWSTCWMWNIATTPRGCGQNRVTKPMTVITLPTALLLVCCHMNYSLMLKAKIEHRLWSPVLSMFGINDHFAR